MNINVEKQQRAMNRLDMAKSAYHARRYDEALSHLRRSLELDPNNPNAQVLQARVYLKQNRPNLAMSALDAHDRSAPDMKDTPKLVMLRAEAMAGSGFDRIARDRLERLARQLPDDVRPHRMLSGLYMKFNQFNEAIHALQDVVRLTPSDHTSAQMLADLLKDRDSQVGLDLLLAGKADTGESGVLLRAARQCRELERFRDADELYRSLLKSRPDDAEIWLEAGLLADKMGEDQTAVTRLQRAATTPGADKAKAHAALASVHMHAGRFKQAALAWCKTVRLSPRGAEAWAGLFISARSCGRHKLAQRALDEINRYTSSRQRRKMLAKHWQHAAAALRFESALSGTPADHPGQTTFQSLLKSATHTLNQVIEDHPLRADVRYHLAVCHNLLDDPSAAMIQADEALAINPQYQAAQRLAEQIEDRLSSAA